MSDAAQPGWSGAAPQQGAAADRPAVEARLDELDGLPPAEQVAVYTELHEQLQAALGEIDSA